MKKEMKRITINGLLILFTVILFSCTEKITVTVGDTYTRLVVDGSVSTDTMAHIIILTKTADYFYNQPSPPVTNATVTLSDGDSIYTLHETAPGQSGIYKTNPSFYGKVGKTYTLQIHLAEAINGKTDYSASSELPSVTHLDSTNAVLRTDFGDHPHWEVRCYAREPGNEVNYYMFNLYRNGTLITDSIQDVRVSDDKLINGSYFNGAVMYLNNDREDERLKPGDTIQLVMSGITKEYMDFVQQVQAAGYNIPFFSGPPANVVGNISNGAVGFFTAYSNSKAKAVVR
jgi:hypothetical protein